MVTLKPLTGSGISCSNGKVKVYVFSKDAPKKFDEKGLTLLPKPREEAPKEVISWPGEYSLQGVAIRGVGQEEGKFVSYVLSIDGVRVGVLASPLHEWSEDELRALGNMDVLVVPADDVKRVTKIVEEVDCPVIIPLQTSDETTFKEVLKALGGDGAKAEKELKLKPGSIKAESRKVYVLKS